jgi:hypothetical protein
MAKTVKELTEEVGELHKQLADASPHTTRSRREGRARGDRVAELEAASGDGNAEQVKELEAKVEDLSKQLEAASSAKAVKKEVVTLSDHELIEVEFRGGRGSVYHSIDPWNGDAPISLEPGDSARVSPRKAKQLAEDFPNDFKVDGNGPERGDKAFVAQVFDEDDDD